MNPKEILLLKTILNVPIENRYIMKDELQDKLQIRKWQFHHYLRKFHEMKLLRFDSLYVIPEVDNVELRMYQSLNKNYDLDKLLRNSNDVILYLLYNGMDADRIVKETKLSRSTVYRALHDFEELGIVQRIIKFVVPPEYAKLRELCKESPFLSESCKN